MTTKIERTFVRDEAYLILRNWIVEGVLEPGSTLRDKELAVQLGVSRTPVREALLRLEREGLVVTKPNSSTQVSPIDLHSAGHLYALVWTLEQLAMKEAFDHLKKEHIQEMVTANERFLQKVKKRDRMEALDADGDFHGVYVALSGNRELERILTELKFKLKRMDLYYYQTMDDADVSYGEHSQIILALQKKSLKEALEAIETNWKASFRRFNKQ